MSLFRTHWHLPKALAATAAISLTGFGLATNAAQAEGYSDSGCYEPQLCLYQNADFDTENGTYLRVVASEEGLSRDSLRVPEPDRHRLWVTRLDFGTMFGPYFTSKGKIWDGVSSWINKSDGTFCAFDRDTTPTRIGVKRRPTLLWKMPPDPGPFGRARSFPSSRWVGHSANDKVDYIEAC